MKPIKGKCRYCTAPLQLIDGKWKHDGIWTIVHFIRYRKELTR